MKFKISFTFSEMWAIMVLLGMALFALWGFYDGIEIGCAKAGWRLLLFFGIIMLPGLATFVLFRPKKKVPASSAKSGS